MTTTAQLTDAMEPRRAFRLSGFSKDVDGRHLEFQDNEPALPTCALCGLVPAATYKLTCKHIFCPACFTGVVQETKTSLHCPVDGKSFRPKKALSSSSKASVSVVDVVDGKERKTGEVVPYTLYHWSVSPFSKLRVGIHHFSSEVFMIAPGYNVQLKGCIDGIATVELKVEVTIRAITGTSKTKGDKALLDDDKLFTFKIVNNNSRKESIFTAYLFEDTFGESSLPLDSPDGATSEWMDVGVIDRIVFERDFVNEDSFLIIFGIADTPKSEIAI
ncbi:hypothetical protein HPB47_027808 [Ixodes persulcatus]|uniref:Uncharacterized protein n=1 Tax=Ixodes persulcatus TaxID=34615 RepID=A0AC60PV03_IXOPE|nr:hypothetical protein HPB47_027808 [Ixodes persulcatus]